MGPPFETAEGVRPGEVRIGEPGLQWGRRSKTAEGVRPGEVRIGEPGLQWGRRSKRRRASANEATQEDESVAASMGPPFENGGGIAEALAGSSPDLKLQWGRRSKTAEGDL